MAVYRELDLFSRASVEAFVAGLREGSFCDCAGATLIFGVRLSLVWGSGCVATACVRCVCECVLCVRRVSVLRVCVCVAVDG